MSNDFEDIDDDDYENLEGEPEEAEKPDSIFDVISAVVKKIPFKIAIFVFLLFIFVSSDIFIDWGLSYIPGSIEHRLPNTKGKLIQGLFLTLGFIVFSILVNSEVI